MNAASNEEAGHCYACGTPLSKSCLRDGLCDACKGTVQPKSSPPPPVSPPSLTIEQLQEALPDYEIQELIGCGGYGSVFKAVQKPCNRIVAIKALQAETHDIDAIDRFEGECEALAQLPHANIPQFHTSGIAGMIHYAVMEWLPDGNLEQYLRTFEVENTPKPPLGKALGYKAKNLIGWKTKKQRRLTKPRLPLRKIIRLILSLLDALEYIHGQGRIHRDVKPENLLFKGRTLFLADFGIARRLENRRRPGLTRAGMAMGAPGYRSPEQGVGGLVDIRTDIYSAGAVVYRLFMMTKPEGSIHDPSERDYPRSFDAILRKSMEGDPNDRYDDIASFRKAFEMAWLGYRIRKASFYAMVVLSILGGLWGVWYWGVSFEWRTLC